MAELDLSILFYALQKKEPNGEVNSLKKRMKRPAVIKAPEGPIKGFAGAYITAEFVIENQSKNNLPKLLFLRKTSNDEIEFTEIQGNLILFIFIDTDALGSWKQKLVRLHLRLPFKLGTYQCTFAYFNKSNKKMGADFMLTLIVQ
jgi:hypothetical protein